MKIVYDYDLHISGHFGRNRTAKRHMVTLSTMGERLSLDAAIEKAKAELARLKLKGVYALYERQGEVDDDGIYTTILKFGAKPIWNGSTEV